MPVIEHPIFVPPSNPHQRLWRYMDFTKFVSLLDRRALFFPSVEHLPSTDPHEGSLAKANVELYQIDPYSVPLELVKAFGCKDRDIFAKLISTLPVLGQHLKHGRRTILVNCWHMNDDESAAMWAIYSGNSPGITVISTYSRMRDSFSSVDENVYIGAVNYANYDLEFIPRKNFMYPAIYKRMSFAYENELRALIVLEPPTESDSKKGVVHTSNGLYVSCLLEQLVTPVYISPMSATWYHDLVESVIKKYGFEFPIRQSSMMSEPLF